MADDVRSPTCPLCKASPTFRVDVQYFCGSEECHVICWDASENYEAEEFLAVAKRISLPPEPERFGKFVPQSRKSES